MSTQQATAQPVANGNGQVSPEQAALAEAIAFEQAIAEEATEVRGDAKELTPELFMQLRPLLRRPIPKAFIQHVDAVTGKPYESTGVKSVQVQMDRLDAVLTPAWWWYERTFSEGGKLCEVVAHIGGSDRQRPLVTRDSFGGVQNGTLGNLYKGSFTNAAKLAFARLGPGWEVYVGAADFDPDTNEEAAKAQAEGGTQASEDRSGTLVTGEQAENLMKEVLDAGLSVDDLNMKLRGFGQTSVENLTVEQGMYLWQWAQAAKAADPATGEES